MCEVCKKQYCSCHIHVVQREIITDEEQNKLGEENLNLGFGTTKVLRNNKLVKVTRINSGIIPFSEDKSVEDAINDLNESAGIYDGKVYNTTKSLGEWSSIPLNGANKVVVHTGDTVTYKGISYIANVDGTTANPETSKDYTKITVETATDGSTVSTEQLDDKDGLATVLKDSNGNIVGGVRIGEDGLLYSVKTGYELADYRGFVASNGNKARIVTVDDSTNFVYVDKDGNTLGGVGVASDGKLTNLKDGLEIPSYEVLKYDTTDYGKNDIISDVNIMGNTSITNLTVGVVSIDGFVVGDVATMSFKVEIKGTDFTQQQLNNGNIRLNVDIVRLVAEVSSISGVKENSYGSAGLQLYAGKDSSMPTIGQWALVRPDTGILFNITDTTPMQDGDGSNSKVSRLVYFGTVTFPVTKD